MHDPSGVQIQVLACQSIHVCVFGPLCGHSVTLTKETEGVMASDEEGQETGERT